VKKIIVSVLFLSLFLVPAGPVAAQEDEGESSFSLNGYVKLQSGVFVPLLSDLFQEHESKNWEKRYRAQDRTWRQYNPRRTCDPAMTPTRPCFPDDHGQEAGSLSMFRATLQLEADWTPSETFNLHAMFRGVRSLKLAADQWAQPPEISKSGDAGVRHAYNQNFAHGHYNETEIRELYLDAYPTDWLSFRLGRQQVTWGETGQFRLLDVINPIDSTWHFASLESFEDIRVPLWLAKAMIEFQSIDHMLELVWVPGIDKPEDMVTTPLTFVGAWGIPPTDTPSPYNIEKKVFAYPDNSIEDTMRAGFRWKGNMPGLNNMTYSLVYYWTHQISPPIPSYFDRKPRPEGVGYSDTDLTALYLTFPRQHIVGFTVDYTLENPIGMVLKLEAAVEPNRTFPRRSDTLYKRIDTNPGFEQRVHFDPKQKPVLSYALVAMRPTMIRWLNPTQNFMLVFQFMHTYIGEFDDKTCFGPPGEVKACTEDKNDLVNVPGYNDWLIKEHSFTLVFATFTQYLHGMLTPKLVVAYLPPYDSGKDDWGAAFISASLAVRLGPYWRMRLQINDFFGYDPYKSVGLFRDRDEINLSILCQF